MGHDPDAFEAERFSYQVIADHCPGGRLPRSPTASCRRTRAAATSCAGSSAGRSATAGCSAGASRSWPISAASSSRSWARPTPTSSSERDAILAAIEREEAQFARTLDAGTRLLEEALARHRRAGAPRVIGRRAGGPAGRRAVLAGERRVPAPRHVRLPDRPDRRARRRVRRRRRSGRASTRRSPSSASGADRARRRSFAKHAELAALYQAIQARAGDTTFLGYETTTADGHGRRDRPRRDGVRRADRPGRGRGRPRPDAVLRGGRRPGRRSRRAPRGRAADRRCSRSRTPRSRSAG